MSNDQDRLNQRAQRDYSPAAAEPEAPRPRGKSPGQMLFEAREAAGLSVDALSAETMIQPHILEGLEADNYAQLGQPVFVRGYYRKCARLLGVSEEAISAAYTQASGVSPDARPVVTADVTMRTRGALQSELMRFAPTVLLVLLVCVILFAWQQFGSGNEESRSTGEQSDLALVEDESDPDILPESNGITEPLGGNPKLAAGTKALPPNKPGAKVDASGRIVAEKRPATTKLVSGIPAGAPLPAPASQQTPLLRLVFNERSWARVRDANGQPYLNGIIEAGSERLIEEGRPPFSVILGFAPGVDIFYRGRAFAMEPHINRDSTARFNVGSISDQRAEP